MREIKFRFWNKLARRFQPPSKYAIDGEGKLVSYDYEVGAYDDPVDFSKTIIIPQQYTGLKDKNGKEIYEGDIVEHQHCDFNSQKKAVVEWISEDCDWDYTGWKFTNSYGQHGSIEVIGNIFENSELLE